MRLGQIRWNGSITAAIFEDELARPIPGYTLAGLIQRSEAESVPLTELARTHATPSRRGGSAADSDVARRSLGLRLHLRNQRQLSRRRARHARRHVRARLPRVAAGDLLQGHVARLRGAGAGESASAWIRSSPRPSRSWPWCSAAKGQIVGYTLANDVSAWDIERENALYLPQSKVYTACCALGPVIVTADELTDPYNLEMTCTIVRNRETMFSGKTSTAKLHRQVREPARDTCCAPIPCPRRRCC